LLPLLSLEKGFLSSPNLDGRELTIQKRIRPSRFGGICGNGRKALKNVINETNIVSHLGQFENKRDHSGEYDNGLLRGLTL
jgi:hypothetical protein